MALDGFTRFGLALAVIGWILLIADAVSPLALPGGGLALSAFARSDIFTVAQTVIASGFALAILGTLRSGFGALHRFFEAVLHRASAPRPTPMPTTPEPMVEPVVEVPHPAPRSAEPRSLQGKNYTVLPNGAVEVETLLGKRIFASLEEARDYIRRSPR